MQISDRLVMVPVGLAQQSILTIWEQVFDLTSHDDYFTGGGAVDINWIDPGSGDDIVFGVDSVFTVLDYSTAPTGGGAVAVISTIVGQSLQRQPITCEDNRIKDIDGTVIDDNGHIVYTIWLLHWWYGDDTFIRGSGSNLCYVVR